MNTELSTNVQGIKDLLSSPVMMERMQSVLPKHMTAERQVVVLTTMLNRTPALRKCTPSSLMDCMIKCSQLGLEPDGRHAHLIPYGETCTLVVDYKGLIELAYRSERVFDITAAVVYENDDYEFVDNRVVNHTPYGWKPENAGDDTGRGFFMGAYCTVTLKGGAVHHEAMYAAQINRIRDRSKSVKSGKPGPWKTDFDEMAKKTVFRRAAKWIPLQAELQDLLLQGDDDTFESPKVEVKTSIAESVTSQIAGEDSA